MASRPPAATMALFPDFTSVRFAATATGTLTVRTCTCSYTWGMDDLGHVTEVRRPMSGCPTHPVLHCPGCQCAA